MNIVNHKEVKSLLHFGGVLVGVAALVGIFGGCVAPATPKTIEVVPPATPVFTSEDSELALMEKENRTGGTISLGDWSTTYTSISSDFRVNNVTGGILELLLKDNVYKNENSRLIGPMDSVDVFCRADICDLKRQVDDKPKFSAEIPKFQIEYYWPENGGQTPEFIGLLTLPKRELVPDDINHTEKYVVTFEKYLYTEPMRHDNTSLDVNSFAINNVYRVNGNEISPEKTDVKFHVERLNSGYVGFIMEQFKPDIK